MLSPLVQRKAEGTAFTSSLLKRKLESKALGSSPESEGREQGFLFSRRASLSRRKWQRAGLPPLERAGLVLLGLRKRKAEGKALSVSPSLSLEEERKSEGRAL